MGIFSSLTDRVTNLTLLSVLDHSFSRTVPYDVGALVPDLPTLVVAFYSAMLVMFTPLVMRAFRRHQVA